MRRFGISLFLPVLLSTLGLVDQVSAQRGVDDFIRVDRLPPSLEKTSPRSGLPSGGGYAPRGGDRPSILLTGYWPPTNEMLRRFSPSPTQNPMGWIGSDWEGRGYDVYSYFPEFTPPDCDFCGKGMGDLEVDYQDTTADFWRIANDVKPIAIITFSRGFNDMSWELEMNQYNRSSWFGDYVAPFQPTPSPPMTAFLLVISASPSCQYKKLSTR